MSLYIPSSSSNRERKCLPFVVWRGRPAIDGRRTLVKLGEQHLKRALELGNGKIGAGIRKALERVRLK